MTNWDAIVKSLVEWKAGMEAPSVTTIAERYKKSAWAVLLSTVISQRTKDEVTLKVSGRLLSAAPQPKDILKFSIAQITELTYGAGFYKTKAENLWKIADTLVRDYGGKVPNDMEALLELPGVGRKTANLVLIEGFGVDGICVDTHVHRISNRLGAVNTTTPDETEYALREILPKKHWKILNPLLVLYGQNLCRPISPFCSNCKIAKYCLRVNVDKSR